MSAATLAALQDSLAGRYALQRELGQGGMATVYLARDERHDRDVAIKVLHPELGAALGGERFLTEIKTTARLQHPHILPLLDSGDAGGLLYYVMPFVTGETLRAKLARERQLSLEEALRVSREVADALSYAHGLGIVHRDIKPENILLQNGHALVADFGIALAVQSAGGTRMTQTGLSLGTPQYMSPEQAMGERTIDARSDVYALGAVTYEMLTGEPPFTGATVQAIVAKVLSSEPARPSEVRTTIPAPVEAAVLRALAKLPADRFASATDFIAAFSQHVAPAPTMRVAASPSRVTYGLGAATAVFAAVAIWALQRPSANTGTAPSTPAYETTIVLPASAPLAFIGAGPLGVGMQAFAVSPDGTMLVYVGQDSTTTRLYRRALNASAVEPLPGTEGAYAPFFSPDGRSVGFFARGSVRRAAIDGSTTVTLAEVVLPYGGTWLSDGRIIVAADEGDRLVVVPSSGGSPVPTGFTSSVGSLVFPEPLPGERELLMSTQSHRLALVPIAGGPLRVLGPQGAIDADSVTPSTELFSGSHPKYIASGHILYHSLDGAVMAVRYDPATHRVLGEPVAVRSGARLESVWGAGQVVVTRDGTLIYAAGENGRRTSLVWRNARGTVDTIASFGRDDYGALDLAPDGGRALLSVCPVQGNCGWQILSLGEGVRLALPHEVMGRRVSSGGKGWNGTQRIYVGGWTGERRDSSYSVTFSPENTAARDSVAGIFVHDVAADGAVLFARGDSLSVAPSWAAMSDTTRRTGFVLPESDAWGHQLRPGGEWIAYTAMNQQAGDYVVFIARTKPPFERWRASPRGGEEPIWDRQGNLVYREGNRWMRVAPPATAGAKPGVATFLFAGNYLNVLGRSHDIAPDGRHLLVAGPLENTTGALTVVTRWFDRLPATGPKQ